MSATFWQLICPIVMFYQVDLYMTRSDCCHLDKNEQKDTVRSFVLVMNAVTSFLVDDQLLGIYFTCTQVT